MRVDGPVCTIELKTWRAFFEFFFESDFSFATMLLIWRGQRDASWRLESSLDRTLGGGESRATSQRLHLQAFKYAIRGRRGANPKSMNEDDDWWALGQHHGLQTPLLDWTASPFVAAYFAYAERSPGQKDPRAIFSLDRRTVEMVCDHIRAKHKGDDRPPTLDFIEPLSDENARLVSQGGLFTRAPDGVDVEAWVRRYCGLNVEALILTKYMLPNADRYEALQMLDQMNINHLSLFPDLLGASLHCNRELEPFDE
jgi:hypothetical protein